MAELTPMMQQYFKLKEQYQDCLLFFRLGDFYEMFFEDARLAAEELDLVLTTRDRNKPEEERTPMCGVPYHSAEAYIARLIARGYKVAICEQTEDPAQAKGIVEREVVRVVTPGTVLDAAMLEDGKNNYIACLWVGDTGAGLCVSDVSTGEISLSHFPAEGWKAHAINELGRYSPREVLLSPGGACPEILDFLKARQDCRLELGPETMFEPAAFEVLLTRQFGENLPQLTGDGAGALPAVGGLLYYLHQTQKTDLTHLQDLRLDSGEEYMELDPTARRNLELCETIRSKEKRGSLLWVLDKTKTAMGGRMIRFWLERPLLSPVAIRGRLEAVSALVADPIRREELRHKLRDISDLERLIGRIVYGSAGGRDLVALAAGLSQLPDLRALLEGEENPMLAAIYRELEDLPQLRELISRGIVDEPPFSVREGGVIREGYHPDVDKLRDLLKNGRGVIAGIEAREKEKTGIKSLKIGYNKVFGYYLEVSKSYYEQVPETYIRKQTLANCERYITQELKDLEHTILSAQDRLTALEFQLFSELREQCAAHVGLIQCAAAAVARLDVLLSFATVAVENQYSMPTVDLSDQLEIREGRHPVVEKMLQGSLFVPNDTHMDGKSHRVSILTGPNMAGKSTYMRQVALIVLMAQMGSFVPAKSARLGVVDRVFTRIGASDDLAGGQSTFMVEMREVAEILQNASAKSLIILDEIGRGTSTYDGMAIARAVVEHCADPKRLGAKTLFATHYHELGCLEEQLGGVLNFNIAAKKREDQIIFLRKILPGRADQSYGVEVAKLAGVPDRVVQRGKALLKELEGQGTCAQPNSLRIEEMGQMSLGNMSEAEVLSRLRETPVETLTPLEAINLLYELKQKLLG
jgi:DNA mismatch repair protein MutS